MDKAKIGKWFFLLLRWAFAIILIYASVDKILHPLNFSETIANYEVLDIRLSRWVAVWLPYLELLIGLLLIVNVWPCSTAMINCFLMLLFLVAVGQAYMRGLEIHCGCFSVEGNAKIEQSDLFFNSLLFIGSVILLYQQLKKQMQIFS